MTLKERMEQMKQIQEQLPALLEQAVETATMRAVKKAMELTPPLEGNSITGTHAVTGGMKQHWASDSQTKPQRQGGEIVTVLANDMEYSSYVDQGHRMDRHFVPGLYVNPESGLLEYDPAAKVGLIVGAKTPYVPGVYMVDAAKEEYRRAVQEGSCRLEGLLE